MGSSGEARPVRRQWLVALVAVLLLATCLRAPITGVGPLVEVIAADTGLDSPRLGLLGALPLLGFALVSPLVHRPAARFGLERVLGVALVALTGGIVLRSLDVPGGLWAGTAVIGCGIAAGNVLAPAVVKRDHPHRIALVTACFTGVMATVGAVASGVAVPVMELGGWRLSLAAWAVLTGAVACLWLVRSRREALTAAPGPSRPVEATRAALRPMPAADGSDGGGRSMWSSPTAWVVSVFMGLQSATFYIVITWLPTIEVALGVPRAVAGWHLFVYQVVGVLAGLALSSVMRGRTDLRSLAVLISLLMAAGLAGLYLAPGAALLWVVLAAASSGSSLVLALSLFGLRTRDSRRTAELSGMAQSVGYLIAAGGPALAGWLGRAGSWTPVLVLGVGIALVQAVVALGAARPGHIDRRV